MNTEPLKTEIIRLESSLYDVFVKDENKDDKFLLNKLYKQLGNPLSSVEQKEVIKLREIEMVECSGGYSEDLLNREFEDEYVH